MADSIDVTQYRGRELHDRDGGKVGPIEEIYLDEQTERPEWALVQTGLFGRKGTFVPLTNATADEGHLSVPFGKDQIKSAPSMDPGAELSQEEEETLYSHYGLDYGEGRSDTGLPEGGDGAEWDAPPQEPGIEEHPAAAGDGPDTAVGHDVSGPTTDEAMTRSEEELHVGKTQRERGRVRLRKYVVTEQVQQTVPVQREEVRLEREPITDANVEQATDGPGISEEEHEVVLHEEEVVTEKRIVPKERVRLDKETVTEEAQVWEGVRKEQVEADDGGTARP